MVKDVLIVVITNGIFLSVIGFILKSTINHYLSKDIENFKIKVKADLDKLAFEHQTKFGHLHEKRGIIISELYEKLSEAIRAAGDFASPAEWAGEKSKTEKSQIAWKALMDFYRYFDKKKIYLNENTCEKIMAIFQAIQKPINDLSFFFRDQEIDNAMFNQKMESWRSAWDSIDKNEVPAARKALEEEFRRLLGVE